MGRTEDADEFLTGAELVRAAAKKYLYVKDGFPPSKEETEATVADLIEMKKELEGG